ncbi:uncharacterized protein [Onthophagus taurus]|uniref:uncharacterized protein n=1 Tax=Onthophagus taurus TaxID=166361 RepID=UPI0039BE627A
MILVLKSILVLYLTTLACHGYHHYNSKTDYVNSKWRSKHSSVTKPTYSNNNRQWHSNHQNTNKNNHFQLATTEKPHRIRHGGYSAGSRFSNLDGFMNRLDRYRYGTVITTTSTTKKPKWDYRRTNSGSSVESLWGESYDDTDYNDDDIEDFSENDDEKLNNNDENDYNDDDLDDGKDDVQAEEAPNESSFTATKWQQYGTMDKVYQSRKKHMETSTGFESTMVIEHFKKVTKAGECSTPVAKVIAIQKEYPSPGKSYMPHCTILHRCSEDTGCCHDPTKQCGPKSQTVVHLYFYVQYQRNTKIERLAFANHTACGCIDKNQLNATKFSIDQLNTIDSPMNVIKNEYTLRCKCPSEYVPHYHASQCKCVCVEGNVDCDRMRKGKEYISLTDRICINKDQCTKPTCEYGNYLNDVGRCPKKQEK